VNVDRGRDKAEHYAVHDDRYYDLTAGASLRTGLCVFAQPRADSSG
jgi:hypothetical protein